MALTPGLISQVFIDNGKMRPDEIDNIFSDEAGYVHSGHRANWWVPTGRIFYSPNPIITPQQELSYARSHFFLPCRQRSPFHTPELPTETILTYDQYDLLIQESTDPLGNRTTVGQRNTADPTLPLVQNGQDYRVLQPRLVMDPNRTRTGFAFDELGMVVGIAKMGKPEEKDTVGDSFSKFEPILTNDAAQEYMRSPLSKANSLLGTATARFIYDFLAYYRSRDGPVPEPPVAATLTRETHIADLAAGQVSRIHHSFSYSDGFGREIQGKTQAEPGVVPGPDAVGSLKSFVNDKCQAKETSKPVDRWVGTGWQVFNNKGKVVRQYEPFFTETPRFELAVQVGVSPIMFYDPLQRVVGTLNPDHSFTKNVIDVWKQEDWDTNDTVLITDPRNDLHLGDFFKRLPPDYYLPTWYTQRCHGSAVEQDASRKCAVHANTPTVHFFDPLGHKFLSVAENAVQPSTAIQPTRSYHTTRTKFDVEGNELEVFDAKNRSVMKYTYTMLNVEILVEGMDMGRRWHLQDVMGKPAFSWDAKGQQFRVHCDQLRRPIETYLRQEGATQEVLVDRTVYGETLVNSEAHNGRGREAQVFDQAGATSYIYDFKGNTLSTTRELAADYKSTLDWSSDPPPQLETGGYTASTVYDAFDRAIQITSPDSSITRLKYNEAKLLEQVDANLLGEAQSTPFVSNIDYDAKGERTFIQYGNSVSTAYEYDPLVFRLTSLKTTRNPTSFPDDCKQPVSPRWPGCQVQNLSYAYDAKGNVTHIQDNAQQAIFFRNQRVDPSNDFTYDALYRLIEATGRENAGQTGGSPYTAALPSPADLPSDGQAMATFLEQYFYDSVGNILSVRHRGSDTARPGWTRRYVYDLPSQLNPNEVGNRLSSTFVGNSIETYRYNGNEGLHGNMTAMPHLQSLRWDFMDRLHATIKQNVSGAGTPETTYYVYDREGRRVRKVTERHAGAGQVPTKLNERIYTSNYETYRTYSGDGTLSLERGTLHIMDGKKRVALVEMRTSVD
jgi:YD repeat-containing protein